MESALISRPALELVLAPRTVTEFFDRHFEKLPLHVERGDEAYFADVYNVADLEDSLVVGAREPENFALVKAGSPEIPEDDFTYERPSVRWRLTGKGPRRWIDARKVVSYFADGYTIIIKDAALFSARLQRFCNHLQRDLMAFAQPNVYFTPPAAQGFEVHHDTHDTLTAQIAGEKTWRIYEPIIQLPLESQPFHSGTKVEGLKLLDEVRLRAGDTLYIPRGFPHEAKTSQSLSLHCTFALAPVRITDVLDLALRIAGDQDVELRHALPPAVLAQEDLATRLGQFFESRLTQTFETPRMRVALDIALNELFRLTRPNANGAFAQALQTFAITPATRVRIDETIPYVVRTRGEGIELLIAGKVVAFPPICKAAFERLQRGPASAAEMDPALSPEHRELLIKLLVLEGLLIIEG
ncbi:MAG TPA: cupin domain-containing protein [Candidatus Baltobacteraceae bacterium]|nr:cupin domain-containing protein [Candidatus Baltobacteraceae bacterium]